jgi:hypothetical protein
MCQTLARAYADLDPALVCNAAELLAALQAIVEEADGPGKPYSGDSYLPPHLIVMARKAIADATRPGSWANS